MYSMKRTCRGRSTESRAKAQKSWSRLRTATALTFTGENPASNDDSIPASADVMSPPRVTWRYCAASSVSSEMFTRRSPARFKSAA